MPKRNASSPKGGSPKRSPKRGRASDAVQTVAVSAAANANSYEMQASKTADKLRPLVDAGHLRPGVLFRAAMEGTSLNLGWGVDRMRALGIEVEAVNLVGGAARNELWREVLADVLGCPVTALAEPESGALGAALQALWTLRRAAGEDVTADEVASPYVAAAAERLLD